MGACICSANQNTAQSQSAKEATSKKSESKSPKFAPVNKCETEPGTPEAVLSDNETKIEGRRKSSDFGATRRRQSSNGTTNTTKEQTTAHIALTNVHVQLINVTVQTHENGSVKKKQMPVMNTLTISQMKQLISKHMGIAEHKQLLTYKDMIVDNNQTIYFYNIKDCDVMELTVLEQTNVLKINVDYKGGTIKKTIYVSADCSLLEFRQEVQGKIPNVALNEQQFFLNDMELKDDNKSLKELNVQNDDTLRFEWKSVF